jgi:hypothetical protein
MKAPNPLILPGRRNDNRFMRTRIFAVSLFATWIGIGAGMAPGGNDPLPLPRVWTESADKKFSQAEFEELLRQLKAERAALEAEWKALIKRSAETAPKGDSDVLFQNQMKEMLKRLQEANNPAVPPKEHRLETNKVETPALKSKKEEDLPWTSKGVGPMPQPAGPLDSLSQAHTLFKTGQYEEALGAFRLVDLQGKKAEARVPVQYLTALCLLHLNKSAEAVPILREVANSRGDEKLAAYAQWQLDMIRWDREVHDALQGLKQRRLALGK